MGTVTFHYIGPSPATSIAGSAGKNKERLEASCFPKDNTYRFRCRKPKHEKELQPFLHKDLPPRESRCCCAVLPKFVEVTLPMSDGKKRMEINIRSMARRCSIAKGTAVAPGEVYDACAEKRIVSFLEDIGLPLKWKWLLSSATMDEAAINSVLPFIVNHWRQWRQECDGKGLPSLYFPAKEGRKCEIEYFKDGSIFVYYVEMAGIEKQKAVAVDLSDKVSNPEWRELANMQQFLVYHSCAELFQDCIGILRIYKTSQYPEQKRFHVLHERYKFTLDDFIQRKGHARSSSPLPFVLQKIPPLRDPGLRKTKQITFNAKVKIAQDLLAGLVRLHEAEITHFSLQPSALFIQPEKYANPAEAVIGHFEYARIIDPTLVGTHIRTDMKAPFLAPELRLPEVQNQILVPKYPFPCDIYSLGQCLKLLFSIEEFPRRSKDSLEENSSFEEAINHTIGRMIAEDPNMRLTALQAMQAFQTAPIRPPYATVKREPHMNGDGAREAKE